ncbi:hypothetical protein [Erythrobacter longus]|uniref:hypothetical protein n=1 Tax=Erythrobacter longus TaxID=1044 RepID=UPI0019D6DC26|nr:hypothetical protein [Erythrobacter longus]
MNVQKGVLDALEGTEFGLMVQPVDPPISECLLPSQLIKRDSVTPRQTIKHLHWVT